MTALIFHMQPLPFGRRKPAYDRKPFFGTSGRHHLHRDRDAARLSLLTHGICHEKHFDLLFLIPFMTPPYIASMGWILFHAETWPFRPALPCLSQWRPRLFTLGGLVLVMSLHLFPFMLTLLRNAMANIPSSLEESAAVMGAPFSVRMRKIFLPLLLGNYAIGALLIFVKTLSEYGTPIHLSGVSDLTSLRPPSTAMPLLPRILRQSSRARLCTRHHLPPSLDGAECHHNP